MYKFVDIRAQHVKDLKLFPIEPFNLEVNFSLLDKLTATNEFIFIQNFYPKSLFFIQNLYDKEFHNAKHKMIHIAIIIMFV